jgi:hypothetical protein
MRRPHHESMKALLVLVALVLPGIGHAASPEENYVAARNAHIKALAAAGQRGAPDKEREAQQNRALADLEKQIRRLVGRTGLKDIKGDGRINLEGLIEGDMEFGMLDGLVYEAKDGKTRIVVTTQNLLKNWLAEHRAMRDRDVPIPQGMAPALRWAPFYTRALGGGAAFGSFAEIPVGGADGGFSTALLVARAQDIGPRSPRELVVPVIRGPRVFIVTAPAKAAIAAIPECEAIWPELKTKTDAGLAAYRASGMNDQTILERNRRMEDEADASYMRCFAERAPRDPNFKTIAAQAQAIVDALPVK